MKDKLKDVTFLRGARSGCADAVLSWRPPANLLCVDTISALCPRFWGAPFRASPRGFHGWRGVKGVAMPILDSLWKIIRSALRGGAGPGLRAMTAMLAEGTPQETGTALGPGGGLAQVEAQGGNNTKTYRFRFRFIVDEPRMHARQRCWQAAPLLASLEGTRLIDYLAGDF